MYRRRGLPSLKAGYPQLFGADLDGVVTRESKVFPGQAPVPIVLRRCVEEIERRGLDIIGLYRLCGSATKKRLLREAFERNCRAVELSPDHVPDINVITGVLKDYLRELPEPLFTRCLFQMTVDALGNDFRLIYVFRRTSANETFLLYPCRSLFTRRSGGKC